MIIHSELVLLIGKIPNLSREKKFQINSKISSHCISHRTLRNKLEARDMAHT